MHTPGPWTIRFNEDKADTGANMEVLDSDGIRIIAVCDDDCGREEDNARLIAAAPELAEALYELLGAVRGGGNTRQDYSDAITHASAILAKVKS